MHRFDLLNRSEGSGSAGVEGEQVLEGRVRSIKLLASRGW